MTQVSREQVRDYRTRAHHLTERCSPDVLVEVAGNCGIQNSPPGSALLALAARVSDVTVARLDAASGVQKTLLQTWSMRGAPFFFPTKDAPVFTTGVLPTSEAGLRQFIRGVGPALDQLDLNVTEAVELIRAELPDVLAGHRLAINELGAALADRIAPHLPPHTRTIWQSLGPYAAGQPLGEAVVHFCLRILTLQGVLCFAPRAAHQAPFVLVQEWLGQPLPAAASQLAQAELVRRYLHCYGPSTQSDFAAWAGLRTVDTEAGWLQLSDQITPVDFGRKTWILNDDLDSLLDPPPARGVRLLPPHDPYTQLRDRTAIVEKSKHRFLWGTSGDPGAVLVDGEVVGIWRPRKTGTRLTITIQTFAALPSGQRPPLQAEAEQIAVLRGASEVKTIFAEL